ncbi:SMI1/KNR4 family protein [Pseudomonas orientalis]|uniref:SMI1/KNR4 family protein n=1 Tax=Pseudomonas orientalis TaxID=76758 RepID=UPI001FB0197C|nr:SMI1/KNR4 family protein [Pseudomonas orientalis]UOB24275.1 SMI1/KNR4 family protein [Pseudomonas orientalis]
MEYTLEIRELINHITSAELYEGDYGSRLVDHESILSGVDAADRDSVPVDYLAFLGAFGFGDLDSALYIEDGPAKYAAIAGCDVDAYSRMYVFAATTSDVFYAFDVGNNWSIVEIDSEIDEVAVLADNFSSFIRNQLIVVKGYVDWRAEQ